MMMVMAMLMTELLPHCRFTTVSFSHAPSLSLPPSLRMFRRTVGVAILLPPLLLVIMRLYLLTVVCLYPGILPRRFHGLSPCYAANVTIVPPSTRCFGLGVFSSAGR